MSDGTDHFAQVGWLATTILMIKTQIGLGVLSIPAVFHQIGLIPGVIAMLGIAATTSWSGYMVGVLKVRHPEVYGVDDLGYLLFGSVGRVILGATFCICETTSPNKAALKAHRLCPLKLTVDPLLSFCVHSRVWIVESIYWSQCRIITRGVYGRLCGFGCGCGVLRLEHTNARSYKLDCLGRHCMHYCRQ